jgi:hypothetical protein
VSSLKPWLSKIIDYFKNDPYTRWMLGILVFGAVLRYYGILNVENTDEYNEVVEALRTASGKLNIERWQKKGYQNILAIEYGIYFVIGCILGIFKNTMDFAAKIIGNMEPLFLIGRYTTATMGSLSIALLYVIGRKIYNSRVGLIAATLLAVNTIHVWTSHFVGTDVPLTFFFLLTLYFICRFYESGKISDYALAAFLGAVTINIKMTGIGIGVIFILAHIIRCRNKNERIINYIYNKQIIYSSVAFIVGFLISNPAIVLGIKKFFTYYYSVYTNVYDEVPYAIVGNAYYTYLLLLYKDFGLLLSLLTAFSLIYALIRRSNWDYIFIPFIVSLYLLLSNTEFLVQNRYMITMFPILFLLNGCFLESVTKKIVTSDAIRNMAITGILIAVSIHSVTNSLIFVRTLTEENTSVVSKKWIETNIPSGSKLLVDAGRTMITSGPRLNESRENIERKLEVICNLKPGETYDSPQVKIVDSSSSIYFELLLRNMPEVTYDITTTELGRKVEGAEYYKKNGYQYFIHNEGLKWRTEDPLWRAKFPESARFYDSINQKYVLIKSIEPSTTRSGSTIKIYKIQ